MPMTINTNMASLNAQRNQAASQSSLMTSMQRLSSGMRVNGAKDDAAGLSIAERMSSQVRGMTVAVRNANDGISLAQTAEGALGKVTDSLQRMRELAVQSRNETNTDDDRDSLDKEYQELALEITRVLEGTKFNGKTILGTDAGDFKLQVGAGTEASDSVTVTTKRLDNDTDITAVTGANISSTTDTAGIATVITDLDTAIKSVGTERANMGASQNRLESVIGNLNISIEAQASARGRIMDADFATETSNLSRAQILQQAGSAMIAQANQLPSQVLSLLR